MPLSPDELLEIGAITPERHREIELHRAQRLQAGDADFAEWERNRELDIAHTRRIYGEGSPAASDAERTLALARTARRREEANAARVVARSTIPPATARPAARGRERRPLARRRTSSSAGSDDPDGESSDDDDAARLRGFLVYLIGFDWPEALIDRAYRFSGEIKREVSR